MRRARDQFCIATQHGYEGDNYRTKTRARKEMAAMVKRSLKACRRSHRRCSQVGSVRDGTVRIKIGGRQGYHLWQRFDLVDC